jgi:hypothetical protein
MRRCLPAHGALDLGILQEDEAVGHARDVVGHDPGKSFGFYLLEVGLRQLFRIIDPIIEERSDNLFSLVVLILKGLTGIQRVVQIALFL